jgi:predicted Ser/Thr protein kinase
MPQLPTHISHYEIRRVLGQGGMGTVYLAVDPGLQRQVALKVLRADTDDQRERFRREARIVARLQHPNIVAIYAVGEHEQQPFIAMEYIEGEPLSDGIRRRAAWSLQRKLQMAADLCAGLAFAHRAGVVHRDVKPSNLMVSNGSGTVRLLDFGIARGVDAAATMGLTMHGNIVGTLNYMSPEQITGQPLDHRSDIFAVGLVLYELLTYRQAFPGDNLATLTYAIVHGQAQPLRSLQPDLDPELCAVVERAMSRAPDARFPHLEGMQTELLRVAARLSPEAAAQLTAQGTASATPLSSQPLIWSRALDPTVAAEGPGTTRSTARVPGTPPEAGEAADETAAPSARRWPMAAGAAGVVLAGGLATWLTVGRETPIATPAGPKEPPAATRPTDAPTDTGDTRPPVLPPAGVSDKTGPKDGGALETPRSTVETPKTSFGRSSAGPVTPVPRPPPAGGKVTTNSGGGTGVTSSSLPPKAADPERAPDPSGGVDPEPTKAEPATPAVVTPPPPVPAGPSDEEQVQSVVNRWARAYSARDARAVDDVQPGAASTLPAIFGDLKSVSSSLSGCRITVQQTKATAECAEAFSAELKIGGARSSLSRRRSFALDKSSGTWRITSTTFSR